MVGSACVGGWTNVFVAMGGSRVLQFCFLDPWCFHHSTTERGVRTGYKSTAVRYSCAAVVHDGCADRLVGVSMGSWVCGLCGCVGGCVGWYVVDCVLS